MPKVTKQSVQAVESPSNGQLLGPAAAEGSMLARGVASRELQNRWIKMCIYGQNRTGKTHFACTFPKPLLLIAMEPNQTGGAATVKNFDGVTVLTINQKSEVNGRTLTVTDQIRQVAQELQTDTYFKTHVLDSITSLQEWTLVDLMGWDSAPVQMKFGPEGGVTSTQYRQRSEEVRKLLLPFLRLPAHTVLLAKEKDHNPPKEDKVTKEGKPAPDMRPRFLRGMQSESFFAADVGGATAGWLNDACDYIGRLYFAKEVKTEVTEIPMPGGSVHKDVKQYETGHFVRCLRCVYHPNYQAGGRFDRPERVPDYVEIPAGASGYEIIKSVIDGSYVDPREIK